MALRTEHLQIIVKALTQGNIDMKVFRFALLTSISTFILLVVGGIVNPTGSSLACPDWPTCYGSFFPEMTNGVEFEHTHRVVASFVGVLVFTLAFLVNKNRAYSKSIRRLTILASLLVMFQGILGGITVIYRLPLFVSTTHLAIAMFFFCLTIYITFRLYYERHADDRTIQKKRGKDSLVASPLVLATTVGVYLQIVLGAFVRHTESGRVCGTDIPFCQGDVWPGLWPHRLHMLHRYAGVFVGILVFFAAVTAIRKAKERNSPLALVAARLAPTVVTVQILLGILTVTSSIGIWEVGAHLAVGALLLANMWTIHLALLPKPEYVYRKESLLKDQNVSGQVPGSKTVLEGNS